MRKVFVCCRESEKKQLLEKANKVYKGSATLCRGCGCACHRRRTG